jgi:hypothetical protein
MVAHFRSIQGLFVADDPQNKQQAEALARHLRTAVDVQSLKARLQCAACPCSTSLRASLRVWRERACATPRWVSDASRHSLECVRNTNE